MTGVDRPRGMMAITAKSHIISGLNAVWTKFGVVKPPLNADSMHKHWFSPPVCHAEEADTDDLSLGLKHVSGIFIPTGWPTLRCCVKLIWHMSRSPPPPHTHTHTENK